MNYLDTNTLTINFDRMLKDDIYVDKSLLIEKINRMIGKRNCYVCITKPRRFGKTSNLTMLGAYYTLGNDSKSLFNGLKITQTNTFEKHLNQHHVIYIDFSRQPDNCPNYQNYILSIQRGLKEDLEEAYPVLKEKNYDQISRMLTDTKDQFIFILDEWDSIFYEGFTSDEDKKSYLKFLKGLLKDQPYVELAYMTGVLPIAKYTTGSELNMFKEYNFMNDPVYEDFFGFSEEEVKELCKTHTSVSYEALAEWYNGYHKTNGTKLFNPRSVTNALSDGVCKNYWTETGPMNEIAEVIEHNVDAVRENIVQMVAGNPIRVKLKGYGASELRLDTRDEILSAMVVYGFLSYHDNVLSIPNKELMIKFETVLERNSMGAIAKIVRQSEHIMDATLAKDAETLASYFEQVHDQEIPFLVYNDENSMSCVVTLCYLYAREYYDIHREERSGKGFVDYLFLPRKQGYPPILLELKYGKSAEDAIHQIREKNYVDRVKNYKEILLVGINYDKKTKHHTCIIEPYKKAE